MKEGNEGDFYLGEAFMWWGILKMSQYLLFAFKLIKMIKHKYFEYGQVQVSCGVHAVDFYPFFNISSSIDNILL